MKNPGNSRYLIVAALSAVYVLVRFWGVTDSCLWFDEIFGVHAAEHAWGDMFWFVAQDLIHPPLFYVFLKLWITAGGESVFWLRTFAVFFSVLALAPFLLLCKELKLKFGAMVIALGFFAVNGSLIKYAQEVRMYSLLMYLSLVSMWLFARFFNRGKNIWLLTIVNILLIYTHYFGWFVVASEIVVILGLQRIKIRHVLIMFGIVTASFLPWLWAIWQAANTGADVSQNIGWISKPGLTELLGFALDVVEPFYFQQSNISPSSIFLVTIPLVLAVAAAKVMYLSKIKVANEYRAFIHLTVFSILPVAIAFIFSWFLPVSIWGSRHLIIAFPSMFIMIGLFIDAVDIKPLKMGLITAIAILFTVGLVFRATAARPVYIWCGWEHLAAEMPVDTPRIVYVFEDLVAYHFWFATRSNDKTKIVKIEGISELSEDKAYFLPRGFDGVERMDISSVKDHEVNVAFRGERFEPSEAPLRNFAVAGYSIVRRSEFPAYGQNAYVVTLRKESK